MATVGSYGGGLSYERGTPVGIERPASDLTGLTESTRKAGSPFLSGNIRERETRLGPERPAQGFRPLGPLGSSSSHHTPLGPLGFDCSQHRQTLRPSVDGARKALRPFGK